MGLSARRGQWLKERQKKKVLTVSCDVYRPAAIEQLKAVSAQAGIDFFPSSPGQKPAAPTLSTEKGRTSACNITIGSEVILGSNKTLIVTYVINGQPDRGCTCPHEVTSTVSGLQSGLWTVLVGSYEQKIDVP